MKILQLLASNANFGNNPIQPPSAGYGAGSATSGNTAATNFELLISNVISLLTVVAGIFFLLYFVLGGVNWVNASGDSGKIQKARDQMIQGVLGMIIIAISYGLLGVVGTFVGIDLLHPGVEILNLAPPQAATQGLK